MPINSGGGATDRAPVVGAAAGVVEAGAVPACPGGDHSVTASILRDLARALPESERPCLVRLDTHLGYDSYLPPTRIAMPSVRRWKSPWFPAQYA